jgi:prevent-host-death family protein
MTVNIYEAKTRLSELIDKVAAGEDVVIARNGRPVARLAVYKPKSAKRKLGALAGRVKMAPDFDAPLDDNVLAEFEGSK